MIAKLCACWLVALVISPFTAPFATYDLAHPIRPTGRGWPSPSEIVATTIDSSAAVLPARVLAGRSKLAVRVGHVEGIESAARIDTVSLTDVVASSQRQEALRTILRL